MRGDLDAHTKERNEGKVETWGETYALYFADQPHRPADKISKPG